MAALRLFHAVTSPAATASSRDGDIDAWKDVIAGQKEAVSEANETAWRDTLIELCESIARRAREGLDRVTSFADHKSTETLTRPPWLAWATQNIRLLWQEEMEVATAVVVSVRAGVEF